MARAYGSSATPPLRRQSAYGQAPRVGFATKTIGHEPDLPARLPLLAFAGVARLYV